MNSKNKFTVISLILVVVVAAAAILLKTLGFTQPGGMEEAVVEASASPEQSALPEPSASPAPSPSPTPDLSKMEVSSLSGLYIDREAALRRPFAVVINNIHKALPQSGIARADIVYEVLAEGDITRLIAVYQNFDVPKVGPVRSTRHYFLYFALDHDAYFVHHGGSPQGYASIANWGINNFDGMELEGSAFWRDRNRAATPGMYEHSSYTGSENILEALDAKGYRKEKLDNSTPFDFYPGRETPAGATPAQKLTVAFSENYESEFEYDANSHIYYKYHENQPHIDEETGKQLQVANVIIQKANTYLIAGDDAGRRDVDLIGSGSGYLLTNGGYTPITWEKDSVKSPTRWYDMDGNKLTLNKGKTWICVFSGEPVFESGTAEDNVDE